MNQWFTWVNFTQCMNLLVRFMVKCGIKTHLTYPDN